MLKAEFGEEELLEASASIGKPIAQTRTREQPSEHTNENNTLNAFTPLVVDKSPGIARIEAINRNLTLADRIGLFIGVFLIAYAYGLDGTIRGTYQVCSHQFSR